MSTKALLRRFDAWRAEGRTLVLATVVDTAGSTYTKAGHRILIADSGDYQGLVSGGCLEGDLASHAREVIASGEARLITYDLRGGNDELFGLGIGCDGLLRILLQRLSPEGDYEPFTRMAHIQRGDTPCHCAVLLADRGEFRTGDTLFDAVNPADGSSQADVLYTTLRPLPRLLVLGAGPDATPVVTLADLLGWRITVVDHRPAYLDRPAFAIADGRVCAPADTLAKQVTLALFAAAIVMSHHLATDRSYLAALAPSAIPYIGLLGPPGRRDRLLRELGDAAGALGDRLHGPAGLDIGADSPESIALSILGEIHAMTRHS
ncbi:MAG: XdhC family protein [Chromatiales bacterium]|nr:XdhC family protein [Chromatiales bacterium]